MTDDAIAGALNLTQAAVKELRDGDAEIQEIPSTLNEGKAPAIIVNSTKATYRQKVISVWRAKGGVGCTSVAMNLAQNISESIDNVALIDLNFQTGPTDLTYYLDLPANPNLLHFLQGHGMDGFHRIDKNLHVLQAPYNRNHFENKTEIVTEIITFCRKEFDAIVFDLPNTDENYVKEAVSHSNTIVMVAEGTCAEMLRLEIKAKSFKNKEKVVLIKNNETGQAKELLETNKIFHLPYDKTVPKALENQAFCSKNSNFSKTVNQIKNEIYDKKQQGLLERFKLR